MKLGLKKYAWNLGVLSTGLVNFCSYLLQNLKIFFWNAVTFRYLTL
jgi:hypothetical protein